MAVFQEQEYNKPFDFKVWKKMLPFLRPYYVNLCIVIVLNIVMALIDISMPLFQRYTIDHYIGGGTLEGIGWFTLLYAAAIVFQTVVVIISTRQSMFIEMKTNRDMKRACFVHLQKLSFSFYNVTPIGYLIARVMSDTGRISGMLAWGLMDVMWSLVYVLGVFIAMLMLNWKLARILAQGIFYRLGHSQRIEICRKINQLHPVRKIPLGINITAVFFFYHKSTPTKRTAKNRHKLNTEVSVIRRQDNGISSAVTGRPGSPMVGL